MEQENTNTVNATVESSSPKRSYGHWSHERDKAYVMAAIKYFKGGSLEHAKWTDIQDTVNKVQPDLGKLALSTVKNRKKELLDAYQKRREGLSIHTSAESTELDKLITDLITAIQISSPKIKKVGDDRPSQSQEPEKAPEEEGTINVGNVDKNMGDDYALNNSNYCDAVTVTGEKRSRPLEEEKEEINIAKRPRSIQPAIEVPYCEPCRVKLPTDRNIQLDTLNIMHQQAVTLGRIENLLLRLVNQFEANFAIPPRTQQQQQSQQQEQQQPMNGRYIAPMPSNPPPLNIRPFIPPESSSPQNKNKK